MAFRAVARMSFLDFVRSFRVAPSKGCGGGGGGRPSAELDAQVAPLGPPAPPSVGNPYCGLVEGDWADLPLSAGSKDIATDPFGFNSGFLCLGVLLVSSMSTS